ncbi:hypothetical protein HUT11_35320 (plasmid) [Streptomyces seoulensis]|nr:hypothetical protein HUT11_35320 [Streptomyces seoulensis]
MTARTVQAAAVLAAAVAVCGLVQEARCRRARREAVAERLMAGCVLRDQSVLLADVEAFRRRLMPLLAQEAVLASADAVLEDALAVGGMRIDPTVEGGSE